MTFTIGKLTDPAQAIFTGQEHLFLPIDTFTTHALLCGSTGSGKSRSGTQIALDAMDQNIAVIVVDIHGDTVDDIGAHAVKRITENGERHLLSRLHYVEFSPFYCVRLDPLAVYPPTDMHPEFLQNVLIAAHEAAVDQVATHLNSTTQGTESFEGTPRLMRVLRNAVSACATPAPRVRLAFGLLHVLLNVSHPRHEEVYSAIAPYLTQAIRADYAAIHMMDSIVKQREQLESALNRVTAFFSSLLREAFGETAETAPVLNWAEIISKRHVVLANLRETPYFSHQQAVVTARLLCSQVIETLMRLPRDRRPEHVLLIVEECGEVISEPFLRYLGAVRKYGCRMIFLGQDLSTFRKPNLDLGPKLLSQCGTIIAFNQRYPDDAKIFGSLLFQSALDFSPLVQEQEVEGDIEWLQVEDESSSVQESTSSEKSRSTGHTETNGGSEGTADATQDGWNSGTTKQDAVADGTANGTTHADSSSTSINQSPILEDHKLKDVCHLFNRADSKNDGFSSQNSMTTTKTTGEQSGTSGSKTQTNQRGTNWSEADQVTDGNSEGASKGTSKGKTIRWVQIPHKKRESVETGQLRAGPTGEQLEKFKAILMELRPQHAIVKLQGRRPLFIRSVDVPDAYATMAVQAKALRWLKRELLVRRPYAFVPNLDPKRENERIDAFLKQLFEPPVDDPIISYLNGNDGASPFRI